jgi:hypothetical protein
MKNGYYFLLVVVLMFSVNYPLCAAIDLHPDFQQMTSAEQKDALDQTKDASFLSKAKRLGSQIVKPVKSKLSDLPLFGRGKMSRGRKALIFAGVGLLLFILPWFIVGDLLASNLALVIVLVAAPILVLIGGVMGFSALAREDEHPLEAIIAIVIALIPISIILGIVVG